MLQIFALKFDFEGAKKVHVRQVLIGALESAGGFLLGFSILIVIWIQSLVFGTPIIQILAFYLDFEGARDIHVL